MISKKLSLGIESNMLIYGGARAGGMSYLVFDDLLYAGKYLGSLFPTTKVMKSKSKQSRMVRVKLNYL